MAYTATITFNVELEAKNITGADTQINNLIDQIAEAKTDLVWEDVSWSITYGSR
jgi:hypothetical protein